MLAYKMLWMFNDWGYEYDESVNETKIYYTIEKQDFHMLNYPGKLTEEQACLLVNGYKEGYRQGEYDGEAEKKRHILDKLSDLFG